ncbi:MAG: tyrosine-type recombinase/integrase [Pseudomonadota bacterium]
MKSRKDNSTFEKKMKALSEEDKELLTKFMNDCYAEGLSKRRVQKYQGIILNLKKWLGMNLQDATKEDIKRLVGKIEQSDYMEWTKHDYKVSIKRYWKWLRQTEDTYPDEVRWIKTTMKKSNCKLPEDLLTQEDVRKLIESAVHLRDKALISFLYESGCRIGEVLSMRIKDVTFEEPACAVRVTGKKGMRRVLVVDSTPYLSNWISHSETRNDPDSHVWISIGCKNRNKVLSYNTVRQLVKEIAAKAGIKKRVNPHTFRHSRATHLANKLTEAQMCEYLGWVQGSGMPRVYVHLSGRDVDNAILELHGLKKPEDDINNRELKFRECNICGKTNEFEAKICRRCARSLDIQSALELESKEKKFMDMITPEMVEDLVKGKVKEILKQKGINESEMTQAGFQ